MNNQQSIMQNRPALIPFITCGDPSLAITEKLIYALEEAGADKIELGIPFSDPTAAGAEQQAAHARALSSGTTVEAIFAMVRRIRQRTAIPLVCMTYANVVFSYDTERFIKEATQAGFHALRLPDVPYEEKGEFAPLCKQYGIEYISMVAPSSSSRIRKIAKEAEGWIYCMSSTSSDEKTIANVRTIIELVQDTKDIPCAVCLEAEDPEHFLKLASNADAFMFGTTIAKLCETYAEDCVSHIIQSIQIIQSSLSSYVLST